MREPIQPFDDQVFVVRCWNENLGQPARAAQWRFRVSYLETGQERHFADSGEVGRFISDCLETAHERQERRDRGGPH